MIFQVADLVAAIDAATGRAEVRASDGSMTRSDHLMQVQADLRGRRVARSRETALSADGVVL